MYPVQVQERVRAFSNPAFGFNVNERRRHQRFPISAPSRYRVNGVRGHAMTVDISSGGVFLKTETILPVGAHIDVWIDWPALLDQRCPLRLVITGAILRSGREGMAVEIKRYSFRLRPKSEPSVPAA